MHDIKVISYLTASDVLSGFGTFWNSKEICNVIFWMEFNGRQCNAQEFVTYKLWLLLGLLEKDKYSAPGKFKMFVWEKKLEKEQDESFFVINYIIKGICKIYNFILHSIIIYKHNTNNCISCL